MKAIKMIPPTDTAKFFIGKTVELFDVAENSKKKYKLSNLVACRFSPLNYNNVYAWVYHDEENNELSIPNYPIEILVTLPANRELPYYMFDVEPNRFILIIN